MCTVGQKLGRFEKSNHLFAFQELGSVSVKGPVLTSRFLDILNHCGVVSISTNRFFASLEMSHVVQRLFSDTQRD